MEIRISLEQRQLLMAHTETRELLSLLLKGKGDKAPIVLFGTPEQIDELREACSDLMLKIGFDENYNATQIGNMLEDLVDRLYL